MRYMRRGPRAGIFLTLLGLASVDAFAQTKSAEPYPIDLATTLRLAGAQNLDVQLARNAVDQAHASYASALESFLPSIVPSARYLHHSGRVQAVDGTVIDATKHSDERIKDKTMRM